MFSSVIRTLAEAISAYKTDASHSTADALLAQAELAHSTLQAAFTEISSLRQTLAIEKASRKSMRPKSTDPVREAFMEIMTRAKEAADGGSTDPLLLDIIALGEGAMLSLQMKSN